MRSLLNAQEPVSPTTWSSGRREVSETGGSFSNLLDDGSFDRKKRGEGPCHIERALQETANVSAASKNST
jgi:hypothetical protein